MVYTLCIPMPLFSKARPRLGTRGAYMPHAYKQAQRRMRAIIRQQWDQDPLEGPIRLDLVCCGEARMDCDNIIGGLMDSANGILWLDDRVTIIPEISVKWSKAKRVDSRWDVTITELEHA